MGWYLACKYVFLPHTKMSVSQQYPPGQASGSGRDCNKCSCLRKGQLCVARRGPRDRAGAITYCKALPTCPRSGPRCHCRTPRGGEEHRDTLKAFPQSRGAANRRGDAPARARSLWCRRPGCRKCRSSGRGRRRRRWRRSRRGGLLRGTGTGKGMGMAAATRTRTRSWRAGRCRCRWS